MNPPPKIFVFRDKPTGSPYRIVYSPFPPVYEKNAYIELYSFVTMSFMPMFWESLYDLEVKCGDCKCLGSVPTEALEDFTRDILGFIQKVENA